MDLLALKPGDARCVAIEQSSPEDLQPFEILHRSARNGGETKYKAMFSGAIEYHLRFFHVQDDPQRGTAIVDAMENLRSIPGRLSHEALELLGGGVRTLTHWIQSCSGRRVQLPTSFTHEAAWHAMRHALRDRNYWLSLEELQRLGACCDCRVTVRLPVLGEEGRWEDRTLQDLMSALPISVELRDATVQALEDDVHVILRNPPRGHFERLLTEAEVLDVNSRQTKATGPATPARKTAPAESRPEIPKAAAEEQKKASPLSASRT